MHRVVAAVERAIKHSVLGVQLDKSTTPPAICVPCVASKQHRDPFLSSEHTATRPMEIIYCDLRGPFNVRTCNHKIYWAVFTDLYSRTCHLALLGTKLSSELLAEYRAFEALGKARFGEKGVVLVFRCDGGGEFLGDLKRYLRSQGTQYQQTTRDTPQWNGISERANRDIGEGLIQWATKLFSCSQILCCFANNIELGAGGTCTAIYLNSPTSWLSIDIQFNS
jgi:hypothetical protein